VSFEIIAPPDFKLADQRVSISLDPGQAARSLGEAGFAGFGIAQRLQANLYWAWDTHSLAPGNYTLNFSVHPGDYSWTETVALLPAQMLPPEEKNARWTTAESNCCLVYYLTGSAAERDLDALLAMLDDQADQAARAMQMDFDRPISIIFLPRVMGHGGFAGNEIAVSYLDRNYAGGDPAIVIHHEMVHILDQRLGGFRPSFLAEGLAVYLSGGHFKPEPILNRAAALLPPAPGCQPASEALEGELVCSLGLYITMNDLVENFYFTQHETGYLQAAALVEFMISEWGWARFRQFYLSIEPPARGDRGFYPAGGPIHGVVEQALQANYQLSLGELEQRFIAALEQQRLTPQVIEDVRLTVKFYDTVRRYQQYFDPSAYFLTAWLVDAQAMFERGIVADYMRRPVSANNLMFEELLVVAARLLASEDTPQAEHLLDQVNADLERAD
jgi:hypothetical protein